MLRPAAIQLPSMPGKRWQKMAKDVDGLGVMQAEELSARRNP